MVRYYMPVGRQDGIGAREIVGALTHEGGLSGGDIGRIGLMDHYSHVDLPATLNEAAIRRLARIHVAQRKLELTLETPEIAGRRPEADKAAPRVRMAPTQDDRPARAGKPARFGKPAHSKGGKAPQDRKRHAFGGPTAGRGRGPGPGKPFSARDAGTLAIRRKPV